MLADLPPLSDYRPLPHPDSMAPNGDARRLVRPIDCLNGPPLWRRLATALCYPSMTEQIGTALGLHRSVMHPAVALVRDLPGYQIKPHPDSPRKLATLQVYLAPDDTAPHMGTRFHRADLVQTGMCPYLPGSGYFFRRSDVSFHSVAPTDRVRNSLMLVYFDSPKDGFL